MDYSGLSLGEKISYWCNKSDFVTLNTFVGDEIEVNDNTIFLGDFEGGLRVNPGVIFIHRGCIKGKLLIEEKAKVIILGLVKGSIKSKSLLHLRKGCEVVGDVTAKKISIQPGVKFKGDIVKWN